MITKIIKKDFYKEFDLHSNYELISGIQVWYPEENITLKEKIKLPLDKIRRII